MPRFRFWFFAIAIAAIGLSAPLTAQPPQDKGGAPKVGDNPAPPAAGDKVELKWKFEKDKPFYQKMTTKTQQDMKVMGIDVKQSQDQTFYFEWKFKEEDKDKNTVITQKIEGVQLVINVAGNPITFDSTAQQAGANTALSDFFRALVNSEFRLTLDPAGKVIKVEGRDEFLTKLTKANQQMEALLKQILSEEALKQMADPTFGMTPPNAVAKGDTWTRDTKLSLGPIGSYKGTYKYKYEGQDEKNKDLAKISVESTLTYEPPAEGAGQLPFKIKSADLKSKGGKGTIYFDVKKGRLEKSEQEIGLEGKLNIEISGQPTEVTLNQTQTTTVETSDTPQIKKPTT